MVYSIVAIPQNNGSPLLNLLSPPWGTEKEKDSLFLAPRNREGANTKIKREETGERKSFFFPATALFSQYSSRADIFACFSLTRQPFYLSLRSRRLEVMGTGGNGARKGDTLSPLVSHSRAPFFLAPITSKRLLLLSKGDVTRDDSQRQLSAQQCVAMLQLFETTSQQCCNVELR